MESWGLGKSGRDCDEESQSQEVFKKSHEANVVKNTSFKKR